MRTELFVPRPKRRPQWLGDVETARESAQQLREQEQEAVEDAEFRRANVPADWMGDHA